MKTDSAPKPGCNCAACHTLRRNHSAGCRLYIECRREAELAANYARYQSGELLRDLVAEAEAR